ncbi:MAG TPA: PSD1 and planctomycete cytochrome C domain-containing protein [Gemmataceae bacterium]|nr:PSD1 and planctomycete cytochrome C domain-containing protein [Gemmataceae bacterium]
MRIGHALTVGLIVLLSCSPSQAADKPRVEFARDVLPIFKSRCFSCHDGRKHKAGLRLDVRSSVLRGGESGKPSLVPHNAAKSELLRRITSDDDEEVMPPKGERLSTAQVKLLRDWINAGAIWPDALAGEDSRGKNHWAFRAPVRPSLPSVKNAKWVRNPLDHFVLTRLEKEGLTPAPQADRVTLIRRLSLDLVGLPPTLAEVDAFVADKSERAYEKVVDRLLASPHYGERWGRHWLDAARYADSDGFEKDKSRQVWFYRDWVINALNRDLPYDQFIIEQLAGDLLPNATQDQKVATGFLRNSMINEEGGVDPEQFRMEAMFDRMDAIGKSVLGLTIQCAQCHNHKFDPLTQAEYYRLFAFLNNDHEANIAAYTPDEQMRRAEVFRDIHTIENELRHRHPDWRQRMHAWEGKVQGDQPKWIVVQPAVDEESTGGQKYLPLRDGSFLAQGYAPTKHTVRMKLKTDVQNITAFRLELLNDPNLPLRGPGRSIQGTAALTEFKVGVVPADNPGQKVEWIKFVKATADVNPPEKPLNPIYDDKSGKRRVTGPVSYAIDGNNETAWGIDVGPGRRNQPRKAVFLADKPIAFPKGAILTFHLTQNHGGWNSDDNQSHNLGRFRLSIATRPGAEADPLPERVRQILAVSRERRTPAQESTVFGYWRTTVAGWKDANDRIEALWQKHPEGSSQLVLQARPQPRDTHVLKRGDFLKPAQSVTPGVPAFLHPLPANAPPNRLTFARWLVDRRSPTTARAIVNRVWQTYFGTGLVASSEDLGTQSEMPSHPELLDWLAVEFMTPSPEPSPPLGGEGRVRGWSQKKLHKLIVCSAAYRQSSRVSPSLQARDPYNRLLARGPRFRVEGEIVRDIALSASGLLNPAIGGRSVFPPLPGFLLQPPVSYGPKIWPEDKGPNRYRRGLYTFRYRSVPYPMLQTFDAPNGDAACVRRSRSNTPLQALMTLNEPVFLDCARALALRALTEGGATDAERIAYAFRRCVARKPTSEEKAELLKLLGKQQGRFARPDAKPWELAASDPTHPPALPKGVTPAQAAAWTVVSRALLNLDETISKE